MTIKTALIANILGVASMVAFAEPPGFPTSPHSHGGQNTAHSHAGTHPASAPHLTAASFPNHSVQHNQYNQARRFNYHNRNYGPATLVYPTVGVNYEVPDVAPEVVDEPNTTDSINQDSYVVTTPTAPNPTEHFVPAENGEVPEGAIAYSDDNQPEQTNGNLFYCRGQYNNQNFDGMLVAGEGCYVQDKINAATIRLQNYQVLVGNS